QQARKAVPERKPVGRLVLVTKTGTGSAFPLDSAAITIGRGGSNDVALDDDFASTQHARIEPRRDGVWIEDIGSTNGTAVNGQLLAGPRKLSLGDVIR